MTTGHLRRVIFASLAGIGVMVVCASRAFAPGDAIITDALLRLAPFAAARRTAVIAIDDASLAAVGSWPWPRAKVGELVRRASSAGASAVGVDLLLHESRPGDEILASACRSVRCVAAATLDDRGKWILPAPALISSLDPAHAAFELDHDGVLRRISSTKQDSHLSLPSFAIALARCVAPIVAAPGRAIIPGFRVPPDAVPAIPAAAVLRGERVAVDQLRGRVVVIGLTALALGDRAITPRSRFHSADPGVEIHAAAIESVLAGDTFGEVSPLAIGLFSATLVWIALYSGTSTRNASRVVTECLLLILPTAISVVLLAAGVLASPLATSVVVASVVLTTEARHAIAMMGHGRAAAETLQNEVGAVLDSSADIGAQLEALAAAIVRRRVVDTESKRVVAHELKTPLASMRNLSQLLAGFDLTAGERRRVAELLGEEADKLMAMISGLLEVERLSLFNSTDLAQRIDLGRLLTRRGELLAASVQRTIETSVDASPVLVVGDEAVLERVIDNLVTNAIKYSPQSRPVSLVLRTEDAEAVIDVMDRGPGVPLGERDKIFTRFARGTTAAGTEGLGLGLAIVQEAVRSHRGRIMVHDREGGGSIFRVRIPLATPSIAEAM